MATITGLNSASIFVRDYEATVAFYTEQLGFAVEEQSERATMLCAGDFRLLVHVGGAEAPPDLRMHLHLTVDDVDGFYRQLVDREVEISHEPEDRPWGLRTFQVTDPNGYDWELTQPIAS